MSISSTQNSMAALNKVYAQNHGKKLNGDGYASYLKLSASATGEYYRDYTSIWDQMIDEDNLKNNTISLERFYANEESLMFQALNTDVYSFNAKTDELTRLTEEQFIQNVSNKNPYTSDLFFGDDSYQVKSYVLNGKDESETVGSNQFVTEKMDLKTGSGRSQFNKIIFEYGAENNNKVDFAKIFAKEDKVLFNKLSEKDKQEILIQQDDKFYMASCEPDNPSSIKLKEVSGMDILDQNMSQKGYKATNFKIEDGWLTYDVADSRNEIISSKLICDDLSNVKVSTKDLSPASQKVVNEVTPDTGDNSDAVVTPDTGDNSNAVVTPDTGDNSDAVVTPDTGDNSDAVVTPDTGDNSDTVVTPDTGDNSDVETKDKKNEMDTGKALSLVEKYFDEIETSDGAKRDGKINFDNLSSASLDKSLPEEARESVLYFLNNPSVLEKLDNANDPKKASDGIFSMIDIKKFKSGDINTSVDKSDVRPDSKKSSSKSKDMFEDIFAAIEILTGKSFNSGILGKSPESSSKTSSSRSLSDSTKYSMPSSSSKISSSRSLSDNTKHYEPSFSSKISGSRSLSDNTKHYEPSFSSKTSDSRSLSDNTKHYEPSFSSKISGSRSLSDSTKYSMPSSSSKISGSRSLSDSTKYSMPSSSSKISSSRSLSDSSKYSMPSSSSKISSSRSLSDSSRYSMPSSSSKISGSRSLSDSSRYSMPSSSSKISGSRSLSDSSRYSMPSSSSKISSSRSSSGSSRYSMPSSSSKISSSRSSSGSTKYYIKK